MKPYVSKALAKLAAKCTVVGALCIMPVLPGQENQVRARSEAMALEQKGMTAEAKQIWEELAQADPRDAEAFAHLGLLEAREERYEAAIADYRRAAAINQNLPGLQLNLGLALFKAAQFPAAIQSFSSEMNKHPGDIRLTILLGMAHYGLKDYLVAIPYLHRAAERDPQNVVLRVTLAQSCLWSKQYQCVIDAYQQILALHAESAEVDMLAGEALDKMQDSAGAEKTLRAAILANPKFPNVHFALGYLLWIRKAWAEAETEFQSELENDPQDARARIYLADSWVRQNEFAKALTALEKLGASDKADPLVLKDLGKIYAHDGRSEDALRAFKMAIESEPGEAEPHFQLGALYHSMGKTSESNIEVERARQVPQYKPPSLQEMIDSIETPTP